MSTHITIWAGWKGKRSNIQKRWNISGKACRSILNFSTLTMVSAGYLPICGCLIRRVIIIIKRNKTTLINLLPAITLASFTRRQTGWILQKHISYRLLYMIQVMMLLLLTLANYTLNQNSLTRQGFIITGQLI